MKWSTVLLTGSIGMRAGAVQTLLSLEALITRSLEAHAERKRQSCHTTYTVPAASIAAEGRGDVRRPPATRWSVIDEMVTEAFQLTPPLVEVKDCMNPVSPSYGTTTVPFGCTTGWPPMPWARSAVFNAGPQVWPPSVEVLIQMRPFALGSSHCK